MIGRILKRQQQYPQKDQQAQGQGNAQTAQDGEHRAGLYGGDRGRLVAGHCLLRPEAQDGGGLAGARRNGKHGGKGQAKGKMAVFIH